MSNNNSNRPLVATTDAGLSETQRAREDRRQFTWRTVLYGFLRSRRRDLRRGEDGEAIYVDWHHPWLRLMSIGTMILSAIDAFLTLRLIERGMIEANPVMAWVMEHSISAFVIVKMAMTAAGIFALVFLARARFMNRFRSGFLLTVFFAGYCCLICYELVQLMWLS